MYSPICVFRLTAPFSVSSASSRRWQGPGGACVVYGGPTVDSKRDVTASESTSLNKVINFSTIAISPAVSIDRICRFGSERKGCSLIVVRRPESEVGMVRLRLVNVGALLIWLMTTKDFLAARALKFLRDRHELKEGLAISR